MSRSGAQLLRSSYGQDDDGEGTAVFISPAERARSKLNSQEVSHNGSMKDVLSASGGTIQDIKAGVKQIVKESKKGPGQRKNSYMNVGAKIKKQNSFEAI